MLKKISLGDVFTGGLVAALLAAAATLASPIGKLLAAWLYGDEAQADRLGVWVAGTFLAIATIASIVRFSASKRAARRANFPTDERRFKVLVCLLENDQSRQLTARVSRALRDRFGRSIAVRTASSPIGIQELIGDDIEIERHRITQAATVRSNTNADLVIYGSVLGNNVIDLNFSAGDYGHSLKSVSFSLDNFMRLTGAFHDVLELVISFSLEGFLDKHSEGDIDNRDLQATIEKLSSLTRDQGFSCSPLFDYFLGQLMELYFRRTGHIESLLQAMNRFDAAASETYELNSELAGTLAFARARCLSELGQLRADDALLRSALEILERLQGGESQFGRSLELRDLKACTTIRLGALKRDATLARTGVEEYTLISELESGYNEAARTAMRLNRASALIAAFEPIQDKNLLIDGVALLKDILEEDRLDDTQAAFCRLKLSQTLRFLAERCKDDLLLYQASDVIEPAITHFERVEDRVNLGAAVVEKAYIYSALSRQNDAYYRLTQIAVDNYFRAIGLEYDFATPHEEGTFFYHGGCKLGDLGIYNVSVPIVDRSIELFDLSEAAFRSGGCLACVCRAMVSKADMTLRAYLMGSDIQRLHLSNDLLKAAKRIIGKHPKCADTGFNGRKAVLASINLVRSRRHVR